jgi:hypothetical protein
MCSSTVRVCAGHLYETPDHSKASFQYLGRVLLLFALRKIEIPKERITAEWENFRNELINLLG